MNKRGAQDPHWDALEQLPFQHSPSSITESKFHRKVLDFQRRKCLGESVSNHITCRAIDKLNFAFINYPADKVEADVYMLGVSVVLMVLGEGNC